MNAEKYTQKSMEAIREAQQLVIRNGNPQIDQQHLLLALVNQEGGVVGQLMDKMGVNKKQFTAAVTAEIDRIPRVSSNGREMDKVYVSQSVDAALVEAENQAEAMKDEFVSVEHIMLGLIEKAQRRCEADFERFSYYEGRFSGQAAENAGQHPGDLGFAGGHL